MSSTYFHKLTLLLLCICLAWTGCNIFNPAEELPIYLKLSKAIVTNKEKGDTSSIAAKVCWVETGADSLGFFPLPTMLASLSGTGKQYTIYGGVSELAQGFVAIYPFWKPMYLNVDSSRIKIGDTLAVNTKFEYYPDSILDYLFEEKFEESTFKLRNNIGTSESIDLIMNADKYEGAHSGLAHFEAELQKFEAVSDDWIALPADKVQYAEVTFKTSIPFEVGLKYQGVFGGFGEVPVTAAVVDTSRQWKTVFLRLNNLTKETPADAQPALYKLFFRAIGNGTTRDLRLDNVRIIGRK